MYTWRGQHVKYVTWRELDREAGFTDEREVVNGHFRWCGENDKQMQARYHETWELHKRIRATLYA